MKKPLKFIALTLYVISYLYKMSSQSILAFRVSNVVQWLRCRPPSSLSGWFILWHGCRLVFWYIKRIRITASSGTFKLLLKTIMEKWLSIDWHLNHFNLITTFVNAHGNKTKKRRAWPPPFFFLTYSAFHF